MYKNRLKELRELKDVLQNEVARNINISRTNYATYENEIDIFPIKHLDTLSEFFNVSIDYLFEFTNIINYKNSCPINKEKAVNRLKEFRKENKLTQIKLAKELNVANGTIANYECGRNFIATPFLYEICKKYNISADYLLGKIDEPKYLNTTKK